MTWHTVASLKEVPLGESLRVTVDGEPVALFNLNGTIHATHNRCTHGKASLADGYVDGDCVECPLHEGVFHIPSGKAMSGPVSVALRVYPVKVDDDGYIHVDDAPAD